MSVQVRRQARISALQALYEIDSTEHLAAEVVEHRLEDTPLPPEGESFLRDLVAGVMKNRDHLDTLIQKYAPAWPVAQIAVVDRNILRIALYELSGATATPPKVAINEAVDLAKLFGSDNSSRFVNGVLGTAMAGGERITLRTVNGAASGKD
ncbi:MAG TPA: transcription antitermination factor NusB [Rhizobiaceae bacterium]|nr:transcription antitermination factor NusB [Rhizobiaceae bacterium]